MKGSSLSHQCFWRWRSAIVTSNLKIVDVCQLWACMDRRLSQFHDLWLSLAMSWSAIIACIVMIYDCHLWFHDRQSSPVIYKTANVVFIVVIWDCRLHFYDRRLPPAYTVQSWSAIIAGIFTICDLHCNNRQLSSGSIVMIGNCRLDRKSWSAIVARIDSHDQQLSPGTIVMIGNCRPDW